MKSKINFYEIIAVSLIFLSVIFLSVGYAEYSKEIDISNVTANIKIEKDIRITNISFEDSTNSGSSSLESFLHNSITSSINLPNADSTVKYNIEITNYGDVDAGLSEILGLPSNLKYTISNYELNTPLCDDVNNLKCQLGSVSTLEVTIGYDSNGYDSQNTEYDLNLIFNFFYVDYVARIGSEYFESLQSAVEFVTPEDGKTTIYLVKDTSELITINKGQDIVFDFYGHILSETNGQNVILNYGTLEFKSGTLTSSAAQGAINNYADLYITGGSLIVTGSRQAIYNDGGNVTISGNAYLKNSNKDRAPIQNQARSTLTVLGGTIVAENYHGVVNLGTMVIGTYDHNVDIQNPLIQGSLYGVNGNGTIEYYDGEIRGKNGAFSNENLITRKEDGYGLLNTIKVINHETYNSVHLAIVGNVTYDLAGGTCSETFRRVEINHEIGALPIPQKTDYVFEGWYFDTSGDEEVPENYIVTGDITIHAMWIHKDDVRIARIGTEEYGTLAEAIESVTTSDLTRIHLIRNTSENVTIEKEKNIELDLHDFTFSNSSSNAVIANNGTLTIIGGRLRSNSINTAIVNNKGTLTIKNSTLTATGLRQAVYNDDGILTITGNSVLTASAPERATVQNHTSKSKIYLLDCTIISSAFSAVLNETGTITLGTKDGNILSTPVIQGAIYGFVNNATGNPKFNYYDGVIKGVSGAIDGNETDKEGSIVTSLDDINGTTYIKATLSLQ